MKFKNVVIGFLLIYMLYQQDGWAVAGFSKFCVSALLVVLIAYVLNELDKIISDIRKDIFRNGR